MNEENHIAAQECRGDFWVKLEEAMEQAGGGHSVQRLADMKLSGIVDMLAQNGIRMTFDSKWHINEVAKRHTAPDITLDGFSKLVVSAEVRYWEDAEVNGVQDSEEGTLIPLKVGNLWKPTIELATGRVVGWPQGTTADIHYKVCDAGEYWLEDANGKRVKWTGDYVPNNLLAIGGEGYGDYIILKISAEGIIEGWKTPQIIRLEDWTNNEVKQCK